MFISALTRQSRSEQKFSEKIFSDGLQMGCLEISLTSFIYKIFKHNFYLYVTVYLVWKWAYENVDEKVHTI